MKATFSHQVIEVETELRALADFLLDRWFFPVDPPWLKVLRLIQKTAQQQAATRFDAHEIQKALRQVEITLPRPLTSACTSQQLWGMCCSAPALKDAGITFGPRSNSLHDEVDRLAQVLQRRFPWVLDIQHRNWVLDESTDAVWDLETEEAAFAGHDLRPSGSNGIVVTSSSDQVMYNREQRGISPATTVITSLYSHCLKLTEHNNTAIMLAEIEALSAVLSTGTRIDQQVQFSHPLLRALSDIACQEGLEHEMPPDPQESMAARQGKYHQALKSALASTNPGWSR